MNEEQKGQVSKGRAAAGNQDPALQVDKPGKPFKGKCYESKKEGHKTSECREKLLTKFRHSHIAQAADDEDDESELLVIKIEQMMTGRHWSEMDPELESITAHDFQ